MKFKIKNLILYPKDKSKKAKTIPFELNKVNVITGNSHRGKSAIIDIIDYCLGSEKCTIPVDVIRDNVFLFAIHIATETSELFIAREEPGDQITKYEMFLFERKKIAIKGLLNLNENRDRFERIQVNRKTVTARLNQIAGFSNQRFDDENLDNSWLSAPSFRDTSAFQFQPQNIVANPTTLFYKADTYEHQNKLRTIFPLILGYETNEIITLRKEKKELEIKLKRQVEDLNKKIKTRDLWKTEIYNHYAKALDLGLIKSLLDIEKVSVDDIVYELESVTHRVKNNPIPLHEKGSTKTYTIQLKQLLEERSFLSNELDNLKLSLTKIEQVSYSKNQYFDETIKTKKDRLKPVEWFIENISDSECPFCGEENHKATRQLLQLQDLSKKLDVTYNDTNLDKEILDIKREITKKEDKLIKKISVINSLYNKENELNDKRKNVEYIYRFIGKLEEAIDNVNKTSIDGQLQQEIEKTKGLIQEKESTLESLKSKLSEFKALQNLTISISKYTELLDIERPKDPVNLDIQNLTIKVSNQNKNREDYFWEIGSGANHMGYHIATLLGLHEYFLDLNKIYQLPNYVPSFIVFDQPSQVYFPKSIPDEIPNNIKKIEELKGQISEDFENTIKIFSACNSFMERTKKKTQVIILEHAPPISWYGKKHIHLVAEWKDQEHSNALIPKDWYN